MFFTISKQISFAFLCILLLASQTYAMEQSNESENKIQYLLKLADENKGKVALTLSAVAALSLAYRYCAPRKKNETKQNLVQLPGIARVISNP